MRSREDYSKTLLNLKFGHTPNYTYNRSYEVYFQKFNPKWKFKSLILFPTT